MLTKKQIEYLKKEGYWIITNLKGDRSLNGAITQDGTFVGCDYREHINLWPVLYELKLADDINWTDDNMCIHVSSSMINGIGLTIYTNWHDQELVSLAQIETLFKFKSKIRGEYSGHNSIAKIINKYINRITNKGGKFNNLVFLKKFYPHINLPKFSLKPLKGRYCIRTSPEYSLPGLLESKFNPDKNSIDEIQYDFQKYKNVIEGNKLYYFYQEYLEGTNGVCHWVGNGGVYESGVSGEFDYSASKNRGDIVQGKKGNKNISSSLLNKLKKITRELYVDFRHSVQLEFVIYKNKIYVVQLRLLDNEPEYCVGIPIPEKVLVKGKTFSKGHIKLYSKDILIVDEDADSKQLLGKKALIVKHNVAFSHILALSKALYIPSLYNTSNFELPKKGKVDFCAYTEEGWITK